jgi:2-polyprenyl-3-methyl-5-hydroxy-6-metoxy-1,4-benzoquinol methylase
VAEEHDPTEHDPTEHDPTEHDPTARQRASWGTNASAWTRALRGGSMEVRERLTNAAVLDAVRRIDPATVLDVGCGEGWLVHALAAEGRDAVGVDASEELVTAAREGPGRFERGSYLDLIERDDWLAGPFDVAVCNFSLLDPDVTSLFVALRDRLAPSGGRLVVQTLHPFSVVGEGSYRDEWREERFEALGSGFEPMPWFSRTLASWSAAMREAGFMWERVEEPTLPGAVRPSSLVITARPLATPST